MVLANPEYVEFARGKTRTYTMPYECVAEPLLTSDQKRHALQLCHTSTIPVAEPLLSSDHPTD
jgi:hypothetical protein